MSDSLEGSSTTLSSRVPGLRRSSRLRSTTVGKYSPASTGGDGSEVRGRGKRRGARGRGKGKGRKARGRRGKGRGARSSRSRSPLQPSPSASSEPSSASPSSSSARQHTERPLRLDWSTPHYPDLAAHKQRCALCSLRQKRCETKIQCTVCKVHLCITTRQN